MAGKFPVAIRKAYDDRQIYHLLADGTETPIWIVQGTNTIANSATNVNITGENNTVGANCADVWILNGDNNTIAAGVSSAIVMNTDNATVSSNGEVWIDGKRQIGLTGETYSDSFTANPLIKTALINTSANDITITLNEDQVQWTTYNYKIIDSSNTVTFITSGSATIDGNDTIQSADSKTNVALIFDGTNYHLT